MAIRIKMTERRPAWHPGDIITGTVAVEPSSQIGVERIVLELEGRAKSKLTIRRNNSTSVYRTTVMLFHLRTTLFTGPYTLASPQEWPFTFQIPEDCRHAQLPPLRINPTQGRMFNLDAAQPLPPTMSAQGGGSFSHRKDCHVDYRLKAELVTASSLRWNQNHEQPLVVMPCRAEHLRNLVPKTITYARQITTTSLHLDPEVGDRELKFKEKFKSTFSSSSVPSVTYIFKVDVPSASILGEPVPVFISIADGGDGPSKKLPPIELKRFSLSLINWTTQATQGGNGFFGTEDRIETWPDERPIVNWSGTLLIDGRIDLRSLSRRNWMATPDFGTFNVARWHALRVEATIECAKKQQEIEINCTQHNFTVLSPFCRPVGDAYVPTAQTSESIDVQLPSYGQALKSS